MLREWSRRCVKAELRRQIVRSVTSGYAIPGRLGAPHVRQTHHVITSSLLGAVTNVLPYKATIPNWNT